jgi:DNA-binding GntR family transcriptional regulator
MRNIKIACNIRFGNGIVAEPSFLHANFSARLFVQCGIKAHGQGMDVLNGTTVDKLAEDLAEAILAGEFAPGARLDEQLLAQRYAVSRTPVREALRQLATTGLIEVRPRRGAIVAQVTPAQLEELFVAMGELEATCARLAALSMAPTERRRLQDLHDRMRALADADDADAFADANHNFHTMIYAGAHNAVLAEITASVRRRLGPFRRAQFHLEGRLPRSLAEHDAVVSAIIRGDAAAAHAAMLHHVNLVEQSFEELSEAQFARAPESA